MMEITERRPKCKNAWLGIPGIPIEMAELTILFLPIRTVVERFMFVFCYSFYFEKKKVKSSFLS